MIEDARGIMEVGTAQHVFLGLKMLTVLTQEVNQPLTGRSMNAHRKVAVSFRDLVLGKIF